MSLVTPFSYIMFGSVGFTRGFIDLWFSFKDDVSKLKRVFPSITYGVIISMGYLSIPVVTNVILEGLFPSINSVVGRAPTIGGEDVGMIGMK